MRTLREGSAFDFCMEEFNSPIANGSFFKRTGSRFASEQAPLNPFTGRLNRLHTRMNTEFHSEMNYPSLFSPLIAEASPVVATGFGSPGVLGDRKSTRLNSRHVKISYAV